MVREKASAEQDLISHGTALKKRQLQCLMEGTPLDPPIATLLFSCVGRGSNLHSKNSFDARTVASFLPVPTSGFLGNGEIGKVGSTTHLHGFTCAVGVLRAGKGMPLPPAARMPAEKNS
uniref:FIST C-domain domain-containing protein n=2 Tax=Dunaliella tertiolecta TaxID=3047 RepID=A0A7S3VSX1_DUNTE